MKRSSNRSGLALVAVTLLGVGENALYGRANPESSSASCAFRADERSKCGTTSEEAHRYGQDFPEDKYDFRLQKDQRTFGENLLHVAAVDYDLMRSVSRSNIGPDFGKNKHNPSRDVYKTKADVVKLIQQAVADGANLIQQQGDAGLDKITKYAWGISWSTIPTHGCGPSSTAASTTANWWSIIARTTWCRRTRGGNAVIESSRLQPDLRLIPCHGALGNWADWRNLPTEDGWSEMNRL